MPQLANMRIGWENEHVAAFLLSRISFVAHPTTIGDDIGTDFFCTLFEQSSRNGQGVLFPLNSFAVQVKTSAAGINATNKIEYFQKLEIPFFLGVIDRQKLRISLFSGEFLPILFSEHGPPARLRLEAVHSTITAPRYLKMTKSKTCTLFMPHVLDLCALDGNDELSRKGSQLSVLCTRVHENIAARTSQEYIFKVRENDEDIAYVMAGTGSFKTFRYNFCLRLAEAFYNLEWLHMHHAEQVSVEEFVVYENCLIGLLRLRMPVPELLLKRYRSLKNRLG